MEEMFDILNENATSLNYTDTRDNAHTKGLWHKAVVVFIVNSRGEVLLQKRSGNKKMWPNMWDVSCGGHCDAGEFGFETAIREVKEELGLTIKKEQLLYIGVSRSSQNINNIKDNMFNEYFVAFLDVNPENLKLQNEEVTSAKFVTKEELKNMILGGYKNLTPKVEAFEALLNYLNKFN